MKQIIKNKKKAIKINAVRPNGALKIQYETRLKALIFEMQKSVDYWVTAWYKKSPPKIVQDESPSKEINKKLNSLAKKWLNKFSYFANVYAPLFAKRTLSYTDKSFESKLKQAGFSISFEMTREQQDAIGAIIAENVKLIKTIPAEYFKEITFIVNNGFSLGRDLNYITTNLKARYPITQRRAEIIARDQCNKATSALNRIRQIELGIDKAIWVHSHAAKKPRPDHVAADGKEYDVNKGCLISGEYIYPGEKINCGCVSKSVI